MGSRVCIIGSGPTGIFTLQRLVQSPAPLSITVYEAEMLAGKGTPYLPGANDPVMLSNIPSIEIPSMPMSLIDWLYSQSDDYLSRFSIVRSGINEREFYPRLVLGDYFHTQFTAIVRDARNRGHEADVCPGHCVRDIVLGIDQIRVSVDTNDGSFDAIFDHVVMATGHNWPDKTEVRPGYFASPWPAAALKAACHGRLGILGTSLSGIDALLTVAVSCGSFIHDDAGILQFHATTGHENFSAVMMSRKGLLPEADFYGPLPYSMPNVCTQEAVDQEIGRGPVGLLDRVFELFRREIASADPDYAFEIGLNSLTVDSFAEAYYGRRSATDPFAWAAANLAEVEHNARERFTVPWRYAILITHEIIARAIPHLDTQDLGRFNKSFKSVFIDDYATVPHLSIKRLLALRNAGRLEIMRLGDDYSIDTDGLSRGARVRMRDAEEIFDSFIDATGQTALSARDLPFPSLRRGTVKPAMTVESGTPLAIEENDPIVRRTGGIAVDESYRPLDTGLLSNRLYCVAIPFLLHKHPFVQGITSAAELGETAAEAILEDLSKTAFPSILLTA
ncbi:FAD/NAD(P)-binding protein [Agrobacterium tumefaciens]|uniref:FAD/NAD(P)-binding protein n=1 Tax=Agrobacterium tumefaciens TaxID=358 RepID=UPI0015742B2E|nr:FAD/NAD(P)-binding protein [Agrobacterium tumefaciens]WCK68532.1 FAD/NAD(P)-binding protein [Agrobacterium tumefaciens]